MMQDPLVETPVLERNVASVLDRRVAHCPDKPALIDETGRVLTGLELHDAARGIAHGFKRLGLRRQDAVLVMLDNHIDNALVFFGLNLGAMVAVPINTAFKGDSLRYVVADSGARVAVVEAKWVPRFEAIAAGISELDMIVVRPDSEAEPTTVLRTIPFADLTDPAAASDEPLDPPGVSDISAILYTSGTTGPSKGVLCPHGHAFSMASYPALSSDDTILVTLPMFHAAGLWAGVYNAVRSGGTAVIHGVFSASKFWDQVRRFGCTATVLMGGMAEFLMRQPARDDDREHPLRSVGILPSPANVDAFAARFGVSVSSAYGLTEAGTVCTTGPGEARPLRCGTPRSFLDVRVVDEHDNDVKTGEVGELVVRSREPWSMMLGYHRLPEETVRAWRNLWLHTGDAVVDDGSGQLIFVDRQKDALRRRGENVSSFEVESQILVRPEIAEVAVVAVPSEIAEDELKAVMVPASGERIDPVEVLHDLVERLPYFMVPRYYEVVDELPRTPTQKVRKVELRAQGITAATWDCQAAGLKITRDGLITIGGR